MPKLAHIAVKISGLKQKTKDFLTELYKKTQKPALFNGYTKVYEPFKTGEREETIPPESTIVQERVREVLAKMRTAWAEILDLTYQQDVGNTKAKADVVIDGVVIRPNVPVCTLMTAITRFNEVRAELSKLPIPAPEIDWVYDPNQGLFKSKDERRVQRTRKEPKTIRKFEPTKEHPGQADVFTADVPVGEFVTRNFTGAIPSDTKEEMLKLTDKMIAALKEARQTANMSVEVDVRDKVSDALLDYVFAPLYADSTKAVKTT